MQITDFVELVHAMPTANHAFTSKQTTWQPYVDAGTAASEVLQAVFAGVEEITLSREDLVQLSTLENLSHFCVATVIWGYPTGGRGDNVARLFGNLDAAVGVLAAVRANPDSTWDEHLNAIEGVDGLGISTYSKLLCFLGSQIDGYDALILDRKVGRVIERNVFEDLVGLEGLNPNNLANHYRTYIEVLHNIAVQYPFEAEQLEMFLFTFGSNLKEQ